jgi:hypothetical protein
VPSACVPLLNPSNERKGVASIPDPAGEPGEPHSQETVCGCGHFTGHRSSIRRKISSAHRIASAMALTVAGTLVPPSYCASFRAARIAAMIPITRLRLSSILGIAAPDREEITSRKGLRSVTSLSPAYSLFVLYRGYDTPGTTRCWVAWR